MPQVTVNAKTGSNGISTGVESTWAAARGQTTGNLTSFVIQNNTPFLCTRGFFNFDISSIPSGSTITAVTFVHPAIANNGNPDSITVHVGTHTASDPVVGGDFDQVTLNGDTSFGSVTLAALSTTVTTDITINASGISEVQSALNAARVARFALRGSLDISNTSPGGQSEYSMTVTAPQLTITYTVPVSTGTSFLNFI